MCCHLGWRMSVGLTGLHDFLLWTRVVNDILKIKATISVTRLQVMKHKKIWPFSTLSGLLENKIVFKVFNNQNKARSMMSASVYGRCLVDALDGNMVSRLRCRTGHQVPGTFNRTVNLKRPYSLDVSFGKKRGCFSDPAADISIRGVADWVMVCAFHCSLPFPFSNIMSRIDLLPWNPVCNSG